MRAKYFLMEGEGKGNSKEDLDEDVTNRRVCIKIAEKLFLWVNYKTNKLFDK